MRGPSEAATPDARARLFQWLGAGAALFAASSLHRVGSLAFQLALGQVGGVEAVGVASAALAMAWVGGAFGSLGLPDRAMYAAARDEQAPTLGRAHGLFLALTALSAVAVAAVAVPLSAPLAGWVLALVAGTFLQQAAAFAFSALRGMARPRAETVAWSASGIALLAAAGAAVHRRELAVLAGGVLASGVVVLSCAALGLLAHRALAPRVPTMREAREELRASGPYLLVGAGGTLLGSADLLGAQIWLNSTQVGLLQCATLVLRAGLAAPWFFSALALEARGGRRPRPVELVLLSVVAWALTALAAWVALPWVGRGYGIDPTRFAPATWVALAVSLPSYVATGLLPRAMMEHRRGTVRVFVALGVLGPLAYFAGARALDLTGLQLAHGGAYLGLAASLGALVFGRAREASSPSRASTHAQD